MWILLFYFKDDKVMVLKGIIDLSIPNYQRRESVRVWVVWLRCGQPVPGLYYIVTTRAQLSIDALVV